MDNGKVKIRSVVFDYGNVLSLSQEASAPEKMASICGLGLDDFQQRYWNRRLDYDRGDLNAESYWATVVEEGGRILNPQDIATLVWIDSEGWGRANEQVLRWVEQLRLEGIRLAVLSNMPLEVSRYLLAHRSWLSRFNPLIFSCDVRSVKPEVPIYRHCLNALGVPPEEILFLDDKPENVRAAGRLGIQALVFENLEQVLAEVEQRFDLPVHDPNDQPEADRVCN
jgi:putative hydrolase of the HAD superfamily